LYWYRKKIIIKKVHLFYSPALVPATPTAGIGTGGDGGFRRAEYELTVNIQEKCFPNFL
jgi:hypothetical protein